MVWTGLAIGPLSLWRMGAHLARGRPGGKGLGRLPFINPTGRLLPPMMRAASPPAVDAEALLPPGDAALRAAMLGWREALARERRMAANTVEAYERDRSIDRSIEDIQKLVASRYNVSRSDILSERRTAAVVKPRQIDRPARLRRRARRRAP